MSPNPPHNHPSLATHKVGGLSFLSRKHGFSCDNIFGYEVVLANGSVVHATASTNQDLWLALKGGSNNFGIITRFDLAAFPQKTMWGGLLLFNYTDGIVDAQAKAFSDFMAPANFDSAAVMGVILNFADGVFSIGNSLFYTEAVANPPVYQPFTSLPSPMQNGLDFRNVSDMVVNFGQALPSKLNWYVPPPTLNPPSAGPSAATLLTQRACTIGQPS